MWDLPYRHVDGTEFSSGVNMFSDERGQGARKGYFSDIPIKYGG